MEKKDPHHIAAWRKKLALTQESLAEYLQISRSLLNMVERGERNLPEQALEDFNELIRNYQPTTREALLPTPEEKVQIRTMLHQMIEEKTSQLAEAKNQLAQQEKMYQEASLTLQALRATRMKEGHSAADKLVWQSLESLEAGALKKMEKYSPLVRMELGLKIRNLEAAIQIAQGMLAEEEAGEGKGE